MRAFIGQLGKQNFKKSYWNYFSKHPSSELKSAHYCGVTYLATLTGKLDFDLKTLGIYKPTFWQDLETESYAPKNGFSLITSGGRPLSLFSVLNLSPSELRQHWTFWELANWANFNTEVRMDMMSMAAGDIDSASSSQRAELNCNTAQALFIYCCDKAEHQHIPRGWIWILNLSLLGVLGRIPPPVEPVSKTSEQTMW